MSMTAHIEELSEKHKALHKQIEQELGHPLVDNLKILELKRRKLKLKEKIERLKTNYYPMDGKSKSA